MIKKANPVHQQNDKRDIPYKHTKLSHFLGFGSPPPPPTGGGVSVVVVLTFGFVFGFFMIFSSNIIIFEVLRAIFPLLTFIF
jgi:hypothetical protein